LRKYYLRSFRAYFDFTKETSLSLNEDSRLLEKAEIYLTKTIGELGLPCIKVFLLSLLDTKHRFITLSNENEKVRDKISGLLYNFNKNKMDDLMGTPEF
jgi:hypothetical protein